MLPWQTILYIFSRVGFRVMVTNEGGMYSESTCKTNILRWTHG